MMALYAALSALTLTDLLFYVAAGPGFILALVAWIVRYHAQANAIVFYSVLVQSVFYSLVLGASIGQEPAIVWSVFTLKQLAWMYKQKLVVVASVAHYAACDLVVARVAWILLRAVGATEWYYQPIFLVLYFYAPIGAVMAALVILAHDPKLTVLTHSLYKAAMQ